MKRTLIVATTSYAGMGPYVSEIVNTFSPEDDVYFFFHDYEDEFFKKNVKKELHEKSYFYKRNNNKWNKLLDLIIDKPTYYGCVLMLCKKKAIKVVHFINNPGDYSLVKQLENMGIRCISTVHDLHPHESKKEWYKELYMKIIYKKLSHNLISAKRLITNSPIQYSELKECYPNKQIYYHSFPSLVTDVIKRGADIPQEIRELTKLYILFFGRIEEYKGIALLYKAFMESPELQKKYNLVIAGSGLIGFNRLPNDSNVIFINRYIKDSEIAYLYEHAHCVVYPYISATQSGVLSLAFYYQTPVVASDVPFFKSIIENSGTGLLFKTGELEDLKRQLYRIANLDVSDIKYKQKDYYEKNYKGSSICIALLRVYAMECSNEDY